MKIRALKTFVAFDGVQPWVFNAGKDGEPGEPGELADAVAEQYIESGYAEAVGFLPQLDGDGDGSPGGSEPHEPAALTGKNKTALLEIAETEGVAIPEGATNREIIAAVEAARENDADSEDDPPA